MHFSSALAASLAVVPSILAQSTTPATSPILLNGWYTVSSVGDNTTLSIGPRTGASEGIVAVRDPGTKVSTWYITSSPSGDALFSNARFGGILTAVSGRNDGNPYLSQVQAQVVANDDLGRRRQAWKLNRFDDESYEIVNVDIGQLLDVRGGVGQGPEVILWTRNQPASGNQRWNIVPFSLTTLEGTAYAA